MPQREARDRWTGRGVVYSGKKINDLMTCKGPSYKGILRWLKCKKFAQAYDLTIIIPCQLTYPCFPNRCSALSLAIQLVRTLSCRCRLQRVPFKPHPVFAVWRKNYRKLSRRHRLESVDEHHQLLKSSICSVGITCFSCLSALDGP